MALILLAAHAGEEAVMTYWEVPNLGTSWKEALHTAFGPTVDEFYRLRRTQGGGISGSGPPANRPFPGGAPTGGPVGPRGPLQRHRRDKLDQQSQLAQRRAHLAVAWRNRQRLWTRHRPASALERIERGVATRAGWPHRVEDLDPLGK